MTFLEIQWTVSCWVIHGKNRTESHVCRGHLQRISHEELGERTWQEGPVDKRLLSHTPSTAGSELHQFMRPGSEGRPCLVCVKPDRLQGLWIAWHICHSGLYTPAIATAKCTKWKSSWWILTILKILWPYFRHIWKKTIFWFLLKSFKRFKNLPNEPVPNNIGSENKSIINVEQSEVKTFGLFGWRLHPVSLECPLVSGLSQVNGGRQEPGMTSTQRTPCALSDDRPM